MELSAPLRWLGALAIMLVVLLIVVPMLLQTAGDLVVIGDETSEPAADVTDLPSEIATGQVAANEGGDGQDDSGGGQDDSSGGQDEGGGDAQGGGDGDEFPTTYTVAAGDTGSAISEQFYGEPNGWSAIAEANDIDPSAPLRVGVELTIPAPE